MWLARAGLIVQIASILLLTLFPVLDAEPIPGALLLGKSADAISNFALFLPLGVLAGTLGWPFRRAALLGLALSLLVEAAQLIVPGRVTSGLDVVSNALGAAAGHAFLCRFVPFWLSSEMRARSVAQVGAVLALALAVLAGWLQQPLASHAAYYVHRPPDVGHLAPWSGELHSARLGDTEIQNGRAHEPAAIRRALAGDHRVLIEAVWNEFPERLGSPLLVTTQDSQEIWILGVEEHDLVHRYATRAQSLGLQGGYVRWPDALAGLDPPRMLSLEAVRSRGDVCLRVNERRRCGLAPGPGDHWQLLIPGGSTTARWRPWLSGVCVLIGAGTLGIAGGLGGFPAVLTTGLAAAGAVWGAPLITGVRPAASGLSALAVGAFLSAAILGDRIAARRWGPGRSGHSAHPGAT